MVHFFLQYETPWLITIRQIANLCWQIHHLNSVCGVIKAKSLSLPIEITVLASWSLPHPYLQGHNLLCLQSHILCFLQLASLYTIHIRCILWWHTLVFFQHLWHILVSFQHPLYILVSFRHPLHTPLSTNHHPHLLMEWVLRIFVQSMTLGQRFWRAWPHYSFRLEMTIGPSLWRYFQKYTSPIITGYSFFKHIRDTNILTSCYVWIWLDPDVLREVRKIESGG